MIYLIKKNEYDVVVVGAGPAGSSTARIAAEMGLQVLLVDNKLEIGVPVKCGEFIPALSEMKRLAPDAKNLEGLFDPPDNCIVNRTNFIRFVFGGIKELIIPFKGLVVERKLYDKYLANVAARAGAEVCPKTAVLSINTVEMSLSGRSINKNFKIKAKNIVGADGTVSLVSKSFNLPTSRNLMDYAVGFQYEMVNVEHDPEYVDMYYGEDIAPGTYAWIIPKGDKVANVGTGVRLPYMKTGLSVRDYQNQFISSEFVSKKLVKAMPTAVKAGYIPVGGPIERTYTENSLVVGDAAGQTIPTVGGGIPTGLICGNIAGMALANHIQREASLQSYEEEWSHQIGKVLRNSLRLRKMGDVIFKSKNLLKTALKTGLLNEDLINKFVLCKIDSKIELIEKAIPIISKVV